MTTEVRTWHQVSTDLVRVVHNEGKLETRLVGANAEIFATEDEVDALYDWLTGMCEHLSNPNI